MGKVKQRKSYANYLDLGGTGADDYVLMGAGFTDLNESPSAQTVSKKYVNDKSATQTIVGYDWSSDFNTDMIRDERAVEFICNIGEMQLTGVDCETDYLIVDLDKPGSNANEYKCRKFRVAIAVDKFDNKDGEMIASGKLLSNADLVIGTFNVLTKVFTVGFPTIGAITVTSAASATVSGKTILTVTPAKGASNTYKYITAATVTAPALNDLCVSGYTVWDGTSEVIATTGNKILVVEIDASNRALKAGITTVTSKV